MHLVPVHVRVAHVGEGEEACLHSFANSALDEHEWVGRGIAILFLDCGTRRGEWAAARPGRTLLPGGRPGTNIIGDWVGPSACLDGRKISSPKGFDPGPSGS